jgi:Na+-driven multidrug efflux pump
VFLPAMALAFAASPVAGQNFGAKKPERVRQTFRTAATQGAVIMALITAIVQWNPSIFARPFTSEPAVIAACAEYLSFVSWNFVAVGIVFTCSSLFQALGNTWPSLASSAFRLLLFSLPTIWVAHQPGFELRYVYIIAVMTMLVQALVSWFWLQSEMDKRLRFEKKVPG